MGRPEASESSSLTVRDNRTGKVYNVPCVLYPSRGWDDAGLTYLSRI